MMRLLGTLRFALAAAAITGCNLTPGSAQSTTLAIGGERVPACATLVRHAIGLPHSYAVLVESTAYEVVIMGLTFEQGRHALAAQAPGTFPFTVLVTVKGEHRKVYRAANGTLDLRTAERGSVQGEFSFDTFPERSSCDGCAAQGPSVRGTFIAPPGDASLPPPIRPARWQS